MRRRICKFSLARAVALAVSVGALGSLAMAPSAFAAGAVAHPPAVGQDCQADGHISGAGSTFQTNMQNNALIYGYQQDVCGPVAAPSNLYQGNAAPAYASWGTTDPSSFTATVSGAATPVNGMVGYNYSLGGTAASNGSGAGLRRASCRTDEFAGTDLPYNNTQLGNPANTTVNGLDGPAGSESGGTAPLFGCDTASNLNLATVPPPFGVTPTNTNAGDAGEWPDTRDGAAKIMSFPTAGGAVALAVNLNGICSPVPTSINLTASEFDQIMQGQINNWNDATLAQTDPILTTDACSGPITRIVRFDNSGTTYITMATLSGIDSNVLCSGTLTWYQIATSSNNSGQWPSGSTCNNALPAETAGSNGSPALISLLKTNTLPVFNSGTGTYTTLGGEGGIGYAELGLWGTLGAGQSFVNIEDAADTATFGLGDNTPPSTVFQSPGTAGSASHCTATIGSASLPGAGAVTDAVGLNSAADAGGFFTNTWENNPDVGKSFADIAFQGSAYPVCGLTFDLVYTGMHNETGETASPSAAPTSTPGCQLPVPTTQSADAAQAVPLAGNALNVDSTAGFPSSGTITIQSNAQLETLTYTGTTATSFTGIPAQGSPGGPSAGATSIAADQPVTFVYGSDSTAAVTMPANIPVVSTNGFPTSGTVSFGGNSYSYTKGAGNVLTVTAGTANAVPADTPATLVSTTSAASTPTTTGQPIPVSPGVMGQCQSVQGPMAGATNDQLRTLYSFYSYVFSPLGQSYLGQATYDQLPAAWLSKLITGYQQNY
jgi:hypothetical protein